MNIRTIDIAHPAMRTEDAEHLLDIELQNARSSKDPCGLKIIHGYGSIEKPGILKEIVRNWAYKNRKKISAVIPGEEYTVFDNRTIEMRKLCGQISDPDLGANNPGITIIWLR